MKNRIEILNECAATGERGWALVSVLWIVTAIALVAAAAETLTANSYYVERRSLARAETEAALDAGITQAVLGIEAPDVADRWRVDGATRETEFGGFRFRISVQDELGRFDLNVMDGPTITALLRSQGVGQGEAAVLTDRILDWREASQGDLSRSHGTSDADYAAAGLSYRPRHAPFQSVEELKLVLGMTPELYERILPALTVYTKRPTIDPNVAPREALLALYNGDAGKVDELLRARASDAAASGTLDLTSELSGRAFTISAETEFEHRRGTRTVVVMLTADSQRPYLTLAWR